MGYRERRAHKSQQKQQSLGQGYSQARRARIPPPMGINSRDPIDSIGGDATYIYNATPGAGGLEFQRKPITRAFAAESSAESKTLITYDGSGSTSAEMWLVGINGDQIDTSAYVIFNIGEAIDGTTATASAVTVSATNVVTTFNVGSWVDFNKTVIYVNGRNALNWSRASGWGLWDATCSGGNMSSMDGIGKFKNKIFVWDSKETEFWYSSTDQVFGTFNPFDLSDLFSDPLLMFDTMTNDGGAGPDDYAVFISENGSVAVYSGTDPGDSNAWSLVGVYKIGRPISRDSKVKYGQQLLVLCEDDLYFIPEDLSGKRQSTKSAAIRSPDYRDQQNIFGLQNFTNGVYWNTKGLIVFGDGTVYDPQRGFTQTTIAKGSATDFSYASPFGSNIRAPVVVYKNKLYTAHDPGLNYVHIQELMPESSAQFTGKVITGPLPSQSRSNISMFTPIFELRRNTTSYTSASAEIVYRTAIVYDKHHDLNAVAVSANAWLTTSVSAESNNQWLPGFGTGTQAQFVIEILSGSAPPGNYFVLRGIDVLYEETGGV